MTSTLLMGNEAAALGAIAAGVGLVCGYPGTPSTEVVETVAAHNPGDIHVEWSCNEKAALEVASGAAISGMRALVTMKMVGLNVASDPLMTLSYLGVTGGLVVYVADDPGPISSQTEQDTRTFAAFAKLPVFDPSSPEEVYAMMADAFELSERYQTPVIVRPTTRVCHACAPIEVAPRVTREVAGFHKDPRWIIFPKRAFEAHLEVNERLPRIAREFDSYRFNTLCDVTGAAGAAGASAAGAAEATSAASAGSGAAREVRRGIALGGVSSAYALEALAGIDADYRLLHVATPHPFPTGLARDFLDGLDEVIVFEELDPVIERALLETCGREGLTARICGKLTGHTLAAGENSTEDCRARLLDFFGLQAAPAPALPEPPALPVRPPVLCAGCPHRGAFLATKRALRALGGPAIACGDIGCYTLGNAVPLEMVDTCLCMGGGITQAQGFKRANPDAHVVAYVGDSTFFASGITGIVNAVYNQADVTIVILDNSTTAMTGHQPHPGTGRTVMGDVTEKVSIEAVLRGCGVNCVLRADPLDLEAAQAAMQEAIATPGVSCVIFESPCVALFAPEEAYRIDADVCTSCKRCIKQLGCPAIIIADGAVAIDPGLCHGCGLCTHLCNAGAIVKGGRA